MVASLTRLFSTFTQQIFRDLTLSRHRRTQQLQGRPRALTELNIVVMGSMSPPIIPRTEQLMSDSDESHGEKQVM